VKNHLSPLSNLKYDIPAAIVVFLVALPLCLGIALASGAPMVSGIIAGIVGGVVIGFFSSSSLSVSGPAAGLTTIVLASIQQLGSFESFLTAVILAGIFQFILGLIKAGTIGNYFPNSVIKGMLAAIGLILILKQIPHLVGYDSDFEGDESFFQPDGQNTFSELVESIYYINPYIALIGFISVLILLIFEFPKIKNSSWHTYVPGPLVVVLFGVFAISFLRKSKFDIQPDHLVSLPVFDSLSTFSETLSAPDFIAITNPQVWIIAFTIAVVASLETLLSIDAIDKLDPYKRITHLNQELKAQGIGNFVSGLIGGLPVTSVIVRSSANVTAGGRTKASTILHGLIMLVASLTIASVINLIPLSALAAILILIGYKLTKPSLWISIYKRGRSQFIPFAITCLSILFSDLLTGIAIGLIVGVYFVVKSNFHQGVMIVQDGSNYLVRLTKDVSFLNKRLLREKLASIPDKSFVIIDGASSQFIDYDITDTISDFIENAKNRSIEVELKKTNTSANSYFKK
jgi:MFS superfamily sulfate permease-like transporter